MKDWASPTASSRDGGAIAGYSRSACRHPAPCTSTAKRRGAASGGRTVRQRRRATPCSSGRSTAAIAAGRRGSLLKLTKDGRRRSSGALRRGHSARRAQVLDPPTGGVTGDGSPPSVFDAGPGGQVSQTERTAGVHSSAQSSPRRDSIGLTRGRVRSPRSASAGPTSSACWLVPIARSDWWSSRRPGPAQPHRDFIKPDDWSAGAGAGLRRGSGGSTSRWRFFIVRPACRSSPTSTLDRHSTPGHEWFRMQPVPEDPLWTAKEDSIRKSGVSLPVRHTIGPLVAPGDRRRLPVAAVFYVLDHLAVLCQVVLPKIDDQCLSLDWPPEKGWSSTTASSSSPTS